MRRGLVRFAAALVIAVGLVAGGARVPRLLAGVEAFRLDGVRLEGARFLTLDEVHRTVRFPSGASVWDDPNPWIRPLLDHPLVEAVEVRRRFPDSLVLHVTEARPVALLATPLLEPVDADGRRLPIDPSRHSLNLPLLRVVEGAPGGTVSLGARGLARELLRLDEADPTFVGMLSELVLDEGGDAVALWGDPGVAVRFRPPLPADRLRQAMAVIGDVAVRYPDRRLRAVDLRYAEQVVVRF